jgi:hypothetical protein
MSDVDYLRTRAQAERLAASKAPQMNVRRRHLEFAEAYEACLLALDDRFCPASNSEGNSRLVHHG